MSKRIGQIVLILILAVFVLLSPGAALKAANEGVKWGFFAAMVTAIFGLPGLIVAICRWWRDEGDGNRIVKGIVLAAISPVIYFFVLYVIHPSLTSSQLGLTYVGWILSPVPFLVWGFNSRINMILRLALSIGFVWVALASILIILIYDYIYEDDVFLIVFSLPTAIFVGFVLFKWVAAAK